MHYAINVLLRLLAIVVMAMETQQRVLTSSKLLHSVLQWQHLA